MPKQAETKVKEHKQFDLPKPRASELPFEKIDGRWVLTEDILSKFAKNKSGFRLGGTDGIISAVGGNLVNYDAVISADGTADYPDLQGAIDAGAKRIFIRSGTYTLTKDITFNDEISLVGESRSGVIFEGNYKFYVTSDNVNFSNFTKKSSLVDASFFHIHFDTISEALIDNVYINALAFDGAANTSGIKLEASDDIIITNSTVKCHNEAINMDNNSDANFADNCIIFGAVLIRGEYNVFYSNTVIIFTAASVTADNHGISLGTASENNRVVSNRILFAGTTPTKYGIYIRNDLNIVSNNGIESFLNNIRLESSAFRNIITNNIINTSYEDGIAITGGSLQNNITGNLIRSSGQKTDDTYAQIKLYDDGSPATYNNITGNTFNSAGGNQPKYNINEDDATCDHNLINSNIFEDAQTSELRIQGVNTEAKNNKGTPSIDEKKIVKMKNTSGGALAAGDVVVIKAVAAGNEVDTTTTQGDNLVLGMATEAIANNASGNILVEGKTLALKVNGNADIAIGDLLGAFSTAKIAMQAQIGDMAFAIALEVYTTDDSNGVIDALLIKPRMRL